MTAALESVSLNNGTMEFLRFGSGERAFVLISGVSVTGLAGTELAVPTAYAAFAEKYTVYLFDRISPVPDPYDTHDMARDIAEAMDKLGISDADIMGASQGAMIAVYLGIYYPQLVRSLVLSSPALYPTEQASRVFNEWIELCEKQDSYGMLSSFIHYVYTVPIPVPKLTVTPEQFRRVVILCRAAAGYDCREELSQLHCPVLAMGGRLDRVFGENAVTDTAALIGCEYYVYPDYAHGVYDEAPDYKQRMLDFFERHR